MSECEIKRDHEGKLHLYVAGVPVRAVNIFSIAQNEGKLCALASIPLEQVTFGEVDNVVLAAHHFGPGYTRR
jgi:hypothetical protein